MNTETWSGRHILIFMESPWMSDMTKEVSDLIEILKFQSDLIDRLFMELLEAKSTEGICEELPFLMDMQREFRTEFEDE